MSRELPRAAIDEAFAEMRTFYEEALRPHMPEVLAGLGVRKRA